MTAAPAMEELADRVASRGVTSVFVYVREAHPGEVIRHHTSMEDKRANATALRDFAGIRRRILLDDLEGTAHRAYGLVPNMTWIMGRAGRVFYRAAWTEPSDIDRYLTEMLDGLDRRRAGAKLATLYTERLAWRDVDWETFDENLRRAGQQAVDDWYRR